MSYDISFKVKVEGIDHYIDLECCEANITWNVREIITRSLGKRGKQRFGQGHCPRHPQWAH